MNSLASVAWRNARTVIACVLLTAGLAACDSDSSGSAAVARTATPKVGTIDRSNTVASNDDPTNVSSPPATNVVNPTPPTGSAPTTTASTGSTTLDWTPPTENSDGTALTNLAGYNVYYGTSANSLTQSIKVANPGVSAFTVSNLASGTWYFAVTSVSADGTESAPSAVVSTTI